MSRLLKNKAEEDQVDRFLSIVTPIYKDCQPFFKAMGISGTNNLGGFMYSGRRGKPDFFTGTVRTDRKSVDMSPELQSDLNKEFVNQFGYPARSNSVFCTGDDDVTTYYGSPFMIFPIGNFKFLWSDDIRDLYVYISNHTNISNMKGGNKLFDYFYNSIGKDITNEDERNDIAKDMYWDFITHTVHSYTKNNLRAAVDSESEIMITCEKYYAVSYHPWYSKLYKFINHFGNRMPDKDTVFDWYFG